MREKIFFENSKGNKLCGILSNPTNDKNKSIIVLCHGFSTSKESSTYISLEQILNKNNISTFRFDFFGHGESEGKFENLTTTFNLEKYELLLGRLLVQESKARRNKRLNTKEKRLW